MSQVYKSDYLDFQKRLEPTADDEIMVLREWDKILKSPYEILENKKVRFYLYYPNATSVQISNIFELFDLKREGDYWTGELDVGVGLISLIVIIDGSEIVSRFLPIGFGGNRAINFIEVPEEDFSLESLTDKHGTVVNDYVKSEVTGQLERVLVYLPFDYFNSDTRYPVIYLQHGHGENEAAWVNQGHVNFLMDNLIHEKSAKAAIIVMANGMHYEQNDTGRMIKVTMYNDFLEKELIDYIDNKYRTVANREHRAIAGLSMGSIQASTSGFRRQDLFSYVGVFSGFLTNFITLENDHLSPEKLASFKASGTHLYRAIGDKDIFMNFFENDDKLLNQAEIMHTRKIYEGLHEWKVWRRCFVDFARTLFRD